MSESLTALLTALQSSHLIVAMLYFRRAVVSATYPLLSSVLYLRACVCHAPLHRFFATVSDTPIQYGFGSAELSRGDTTARQKIIVRVKMATESILSLW